MYVHVWVYISSSLLSGQLVDLHALFSFQVLSLSDVLHCMYAFHVWVCLLSMRVGI